MESEISFYFSQGLAAFLCPEPHKSGRNTPPIYLFRSPSIFSPIYIQVSPSVTFPSAVLTKNLYEPLLSPVYAT
jgi:hypothetical protein